MSSKSSYQLVPLTEESQWKQFHKVPHHIYKDDPNWIFPLESDVRDIFDPAKNKTVKDGDFQLWILLNELGKPVGRIAAFIDHGRNKTLPYPVGGMGFFESVDDDEAAKLLLNAAEEWVCQFGVKAIDGPINYGERDKFYGLLVKGFKPPLYQEYYHPPYYRRFIENQGYKPYEQILTFSALMKDVPIERFRSISKRAQDRYPISVKFYDPKDMRGFAEDFTIDYNQAFRHFEHFKELTVEQIMETFQAAKPIIDPRVAMIAYYNDEPAGLAGFLPDINPFLKHAKGKLNLWALPKFLYKLKFSKNRILKGIAWGIVPKHQRHGIYALMVDEIYTAYLKETYKVFCLATIRGHNTAMVKTSLNLGVSVEREHYHYRKMLDDSISFEPMEFYEGD